MENFPGLVMDSEPGSPDLEILLMLDRPEVNYSQLVVLAGWLRTVVDLMGQSPYHGVVGNYLQRVDVLHQDVAGDIFKLDVI